MMREIKFRMWNNGKMRYGVEMSEDFPYMVAPQGEYVNCKLMQYTGLKDKNEKEIYEADIVRVVTDEKGVIGEVVYIPEETAFCVKAKGFEIFPLGFLNNWFEIEVLGNIYENPELLEMIR
ncbi:YopX family protein [Paraclostridium dentum]|uniref:YopX family protein n=1 Tax=Paraclostridium dentum TaxID=2662455 RepID=UPI00346433D0